ncbi:DUF3592 domain-containing protein [Pontibacter sp. G13]|uniref:DUF3592 domain-containing protein n=1 Tax=Pontibacter sp. G13 TaxID=3074898 RepID=UPI0028891297|nr:DUF3592 domain-containing protein [Pontibacter sp. G13]WNJ19390.1 DUF3592 domain-containing protein [Pontibacter sp. G13]
MNVLLDFSAEWMGWGLLCLGCLIASNPLRALFISMISGKWETASATILKSEIAEVPDEDGAPMYALDISYEFHWEGETYFSTGRFADLEPFFPSSKPVQMLIEAYRSGDEVPVRFHPDQPQESVLETKFPAHQRLTLALAAGVILAGIWLTGFGG